MIRRRIFEMAYVVLTTLRHRDRFVTEADLDVHPVVCGVVVPEPRAVRGRTWKELRAN